MADKIISLGDGASKIRLADQNDGTMARVMTAGTPAGVGADRLLDIGGAKIRMKNMGDGTFAKVVIGK